MWCVLIRRARFEEAFARALDEITIALVPQILRRPHDRSRIHPDLLRQLARRQKHRSLKLVIHVFHNALALRAELRIARYDPLLE